MKCPICDAVIPEWLWFDSSRVIAQCPKDPNHFFYHIEPLLEKSLSEIVTEREKRIRKELIPQLAPPLKEEYPNATLLMAPIDPKKAKIIASIGSRVASPTIGNGANNITREELDKLIDEYMMTVRIIFAEIGFEKRNFKSAKGGQCKKF